MASIGPLLVDICHTCTQTHMHAFTLACMLLCTDSHAHFHTCMDSPMHTPMHRYPCIHMYGYMHTHSQRTCNHAYTHVQCTHTVVHACTYSCKYAYKHTHALVSGPAFWDRCPVSAWKQAQACPSPLHGRVISLGYSSSLPLSWPGPDLLSLTPTPFVSLRPVVISDPRSSDMAPFHSTCFSVSPLSRYADPKLL